MQHRRKNLAYLKSGKCATFYVVKTWYKIIQGKTY